MGAQMRKRWIVYKRNISMLFIEIIIPLLFVLVALCFTLVQFFFDSPTYALNPSNKLPVPSPVYFSSNPNNPWDPTQTFSSYFTSSEITQRSVTYTTNANVITDMTNFDDAVFNTREGLSETIYGAYYPITFPATTANKNFEFMVLSNIRDTHSTAVFTA